MRFTLPMTRALLLSWTNTVTVWIKEVNVGIEGRRALRGQQLKEDGAEAHNAAVPHSSLSADGVQHIIIENVAAKLGVLTTEDVGGIKLRIRPRPCRHRRRTEGLVSHQKSDRGFLLVWTMTMTVTSSQTGGTQTHANGRAGKWRNVANALVSPVSFVKSAGSSTPPCSHFF